MKSEVAIEVVSAGALTTRQNLGRPGLTHLGISPGGAADSLALRIGNRLVGNRPNTTAIEITAGGVILRMQRKLWVALTGGVCKQKVNEVPMAMWQSFVVEAGQVLQIEAATQGLRSYFCVHGGISDSLRTNDRCDTHQEENPVTSGTTLDVGESDGSLPAPRRAAQDVRLLYREPYVLRVTRGLQWHWFSASSWQEFTSHPLMVTSDSSRRGTRLTSSRNIGRINHDELLTEGVCAGTIQVPADGQPILLGCEQQTTGGYPKIATVISADLFLTGQLRPGTSMRFCEVSLADAWRIGRDRENLLRNGVHLL